MKIFLWVARAEGLSLLLLFGLAMPLKYGLGWQHATMVPGWIHGVLFLAYIGLLAQQAHQQAWSPGRIGAGLVASLLPFGTFMFERSLEPYKAAPS